MDVKDQAIVEMLLLNPLFAVSKHRVGDLLLNYMPSCSNDPGEVYYYKQAANKSTPLVKIGLSRVGSKQRVKTQATRNNEEYAILGRFRTSHVAYFEVLAHTHFGERRVKYQSCRRGQEWFVAGFKEVLAALAPLAMVVDELFGAFAGDGESPLDETERESEKTKYKSSRAITATNARARLQTQARRHPSLPRQRNQNRH